MDRSINSGGRHDFNSKIYGGIYFEANTQASTVAAADTWYRIGQANAAAVLYGNILPTSLGTNPYWTLSGATTAAQILTYTGKYSVLTAHWGATLVAGTASNYVFRLVRTGVAVAGTTVGTAVSVATFRASLRHSIITTVSTGDTFYIEFQNNTGATNTTFISSEIVFTQ
jgi:hypothetical protein